MDKIHRRELFADFAHTLARIEWQFFNTHTFNNLLPKTYVRGSMFWRWARDVSEISKVPYKNLLIALRGEQGEIGARPHFHSLVGGGLDEATKTIGQFWKRKNARRNGFIANNLG